MTPDTYLCDGVTISGDRQDADRLARYYSLPVLGAGGYRTAYLLPDGRVLKVDHHDNSRGGCDIEADRYARASDAFRDLLPTIHAHGEGWLVMDKVITLSDEPADKRPYVLREDLQSHPTPWATDRSRQDSWGSVRDLISATISRIGESVWDLHCHNVGIKPDTLQPCIIDFAGCS